MSKAEDLAKEFLKKLVSHTTLYKGTIDELEVYEPDDVIWAYKEGYHQAEKDLLANKHEKSWRLDEKLWKCIKDVEEASYQYTYDASNDWAYDVPTWDDVQDAFKAGSEWKENHELTWEDIEKIVDLYDDVYCDFSNDGNGGKIDAEEHYQEVLKRFKEKKGEVLKKRKEKY